MRVAIRLAVVITILFGIAACTRAPADPGPQINDLPPLADGAGRIFFYRAGMFGYSVEPHAYLDNKFLGKFVNGQFLVVDAPPGPHDVATTMDAEKRLSFTLEDGETRYIEMSVGLDVMFGNVALDFRNFEAALPDLNNLRMQRYQHMNEDGKLKQVHVRRAMVSSTQPAKEMKPAEAEEKMPEKKPEQMAQNDNREDPGKDEDTKEQMAEKPSMHEQTDKSDDDTHSRLLAVELGMESLTTRVDRLNSEVRKLSALGAYLSAKSTGMPAPEPESAPMPLTKPAMDAKKDEKAEPKQAAVKPAPKPTGGFGIHLSSYRNENALNKGAARLRKSLELELEDLDHTQEPVAVKDKGTFYRLIYGPVGQRTIAAGICQAIKDKGVKYCKVVKWP